MATSVTVGVTDNQALVPFFYLRITGFPYYVFATVLPNASAYGSFAWATPTGFPATWAQRGLQLPEEQIDQKFPDIIGGVATPGRIKLSVMDFPDPTNIGKGFFSRLFAPGRALSDSSLAKGVISTSMSAVPGAETTVFVREQTGTWTIPSDVYLGAETIGVSADTPVDASRHNLTIASRNKYVCYGNRGDGGSYWPPDPYHIIGNDSTGAVVASPMVTAEAMDTLGRTAALWMGHMRPDGNPEPESSSTCLLLGRITDIGVGKVGGMFDITIESITADLTKAKVAPDLAHGTIQDGFYLQSAAWCTFYASTVGAVSITPAVYSTPQSLANAVNVALAAAGATFLTLQVVVNGNDTVFGFLSKDSGVTTYTVGSSPFSSAGTTPPGAESLLHALGFDPAQPTFTITGSTSTTPLVAQRPIAHVFVPALNNSQDINLVEPDAAGRFFTDPGDGTGQAWGRFGDGQIVKINGAASGSTNTVQTGSSLATSALFTKVDDSDSSFGRFYYVEVGITATIDQAILFSSIAGGINGGSYTRFLGRLLASTKGHSSGGDGILNIYPRYVGLGWNVLMTASEWLQADETGISRIAYVDSSTKWIDLFKPYSREHALFVTWNPTTSGISLRRLVVPQGASAGTNVSFSESNRASVGDRTSQKVDRSSIRTSWKLKPGLSFTVKNPPAINVIDVRGRAMYPNDDRAEELTDDTLIEGTALSDIIHHLVQLYSTPWTTCSRSMNKRGMLLAPGTIHRVIDNTMINPFTGATGIVSADDVFCFLTRVAFTPATGVTTIEFVINSTDDQSLYRPWSPTALVDFSLTGGGFTRGYSSATKQLSTVNNYYGVDSDSLSFAAGDTVRIITRDNSDDTATSSQTDTIASVSNEIITLTTGISALSAVSQTIVVLQKYNSATTTRKTGATKVAWQGDGDTKVIQGSTTARLNRWA